MPRLRLTDTAIAKIKVTDKDRDYFWDTEVPKLAILAYRSGSKSWIVQFVRDGRDVRVNLGVPPAMTVQEARRKALEAMVAPAEPKTPVAVLRVASKTLLETAAAYIEDRLPGKPSYDKQQRLLRRALPSWLAEKPMDEVTMEDLRKVHRDLTAKSGTGNSLASLLRTVANYALEKRWITVDPFPTKMSLHPTKRRKRALTRDQYKALLGAIRERQEADDRLQWLALEAVILSGGRKVEMLSLRHDEIDRAAMVITKTSHKTAAKVGAKEIPLTPQLLDVVARAEAWKQRFVETHPDEVQISQRLKTSPYVFPTPGRRESRAGYLANVDDDAQSLFDGLEAQGVLPEDFVIHHLRSAFISMAMAQGLKVEVVAKLVGHADVNTTLRHYREISTDEMDQGRAVVSDFFAKL